MGLAIEHQNGLPGAGPPVDPPRGSGRTAANPHLISDSVAMMLVIVALLNRQTSAKLCDMQKKSTISRYAQDMPNKVEASLAKLAKEDDKTPLPDDVVQYLRDNKIPVNGMTIGEFLIEKAMPGNDPAKFVEMITKMQRMITSRRRTGCNRANGRMP
ncbi:hypothetical protein [Burkholderia ubonensis]|uniref:hypothetical protein n=1 Tax=Burkholderia ubonensis TaxID=101571 RepID=UPI000ACB5EBB|nr:hypothetical protein [Burkholderia ubonensis]